MVTWRPITGAEALDPAARKFLWTVPSEISGNCYVMVRTKDLRASDVSDAAFSIKPCARSITITYPNGREPEGEAQALQVRSTQMITWALDGSFSGDGLKLTLIVNGTEEYPIASKVPYSPAYKWTVPDKVSPRCKVRIEDMNGCARDESDFNFVIAAAPAKIVVDEPHGGEKLGVGDQFKIKWTTSGQVPLVRIDIGTRVG
mgnify:FL=1